MPSSFIVDLSESFFEYLTTSSPDMLLQTSFICYTPFDLRLIDFTFYISNIIFMVAHVDSPNTLILSSLLYVHILPVYLKCME